MRGSYLFTSESVSEGHPDKVCDRISDEIVDLFFREGPKAGIDPWAIRAACETLATTNKVVIAGDSAGGGLTVATLVAARDAGLPQPAGGACISPWADLTCSLGTYSTKAAADPVVDARLIRRMAEAYLGGRDARTPLASPLHADLGGLPPLLVQVGGAEVLLDRFDAKNIQDVIEPGRTNVARKRFGLF